MIIGDGIVWALLDGEAVVLSVTSGIYFGLNRPGTAAWMLLAKGADEEEMFASLLAEYDVDPIQLREDLVSFLASLHAKKLVRFAGG